jgi:hypothetical protein
VEYNNFFHGLTSLIVVCLFIVEFSRSHSRDITRGRTPLDRWLALCLSTHNTNNRQTSMPLAGFEPEIPSSKQPQTHDLDRTATALSWSIIIALELLNFPLWRGYRNSEIFLILNMEPFWLYCFTKLLNRMKVPEDTCNCCCLSPQAFHKISTALAFVYQNIDLQ